MRKNEFVVTLALSISIVFCANPCKALAENRQHQFLEKVDCIKSLGDLESSIARCLIDDKKEFIKLQESVASSKEPWILQISNDWPESSSNKKQLIAFETEIPGKKGNFIYLVHDDGEVEEYPERALLFDSISMSSGTSVTRAWIKAGTEKDPLYVIAAHPMHGGSVKTEKYMNDVAQKGKVHDERITFRSQPLLANQDQGGSFGFAGDLPFQKAFDNGAKAKFKRLAVLLRNAQGKTREHLKSCLMKNDENPATENASGTQELPISKSCDNAFSDSAGSLRKALLKARYSGRSFIKNQDKGAAAQPAY